MFNKIFNRKYYKAIKEIKKQIKLYKNLEVSFKQELAEGITNAHAADWYLNNLKEFEYKREALEELLLKITKPTF